MFRSPHLELVCPSCRKNHDGKFSPEFWRHDHYKRLTCDCGYKIFFKTPECNSGHY